MRQNRARAAAVQIDPRILWLAGGIVLAALAGHAALAQQAQPAPPGDESTTTGVIRPPAQVDPGIKAKPPVPAAALPTPVIPPPGTAGGNPSVQPK